MDELERLQIKRSYEYDEELMDSGRYVDPQSLRVRLILADQERGMLLAEVEHVESQAAALREALKVVMWASLETGQVYCQWCATSEGEEHLSECQGHSALATDAGRPLSGRDS